MCVFVHLWIRRKKGEKSVGSATGGEISKDIRIDVALRNWNVESRWAREYFYHEVASSKHIKYENSRQKKITTSKNSPIRSGQRITVDSSYRNGVWVFLAFISTNRISNSPSADFSSFAGTILFICTRYTWNVTDDRLCECSAIIAAKPSASVLQTPER